MFRTLILCLALAAPALAQRGEEYPPDLAPLTTREPVLPLPRITSLALEPRYFGPRIDVGLINPRPPEESELDMESGLRSFLPDEETVERDRERLRPLVAAMQGIWRVERMAVDGVDLAPSEFAGTKYLIQGLSIAQSETSEAWERAWPTPPVRVQLPPVPVEYGPPGDRARVIIPPPVDVVRLGPAGVSRPAGAVERNDPKQEEDVRMNLVYQAPDRARVYWWNRYGESADPHLSRDRPSLRVAWPVRGNLQVAAGVVALDVRGFGLRSLLPSRFHESFNPLAPAGREWQTALEPERRLRLVLVRDEALVDPIRETRSNIIPTMRRVRMEWEP
jgi:hypothetical protein